MNKRPIYVCECCDHAFVELTKGAVTLVSLADVALLASRTWYTLTRSRYAASGGGKVPVRYLHRVILDVPSTAEVDHANRNTLDNRRENLRVATRSEQQVNRRYDNKTGYRGVYATGFGTFAASITFKGVKRHLGCFPTAAQAHEAYKKAAVELHKEFAFAS